MVLLLAGQVAAQPNVTSDAPPNRAAIQAAVNDLRRDPNLGRDRTVKSLRWIKTETPEPAQPPNWIVGLFQFLSQAAGLVLWVAGGIGLAFAAVWVYRLVQSRRPAPPVAAPEAASTVQELDIRPASLPADVGAAALALLGAGRTREALSLLYRGALSRAVHSFSVPITSSYTEGEALRAVNQRMDPPRVRYFAALISLWQRAVYAEETLPTEAVAALCREFSPVLGVTPI
jgi:hypothetical protein